MTETMKVGPQGQVVIPKEVRDELGIQLGDEVIVDAVDGEARLRRRPEATSVLGMLAQGKDDYDMLADLDREEIARDERPAAALDAGRMLSSPSTGPAPAT